MNMTPDDIGRYERPGSANTAFARLPTTSIHTRTFISPATWSLPSAATATKSGAKARASLLRCGAGASSIYLATRRCWLKAPSGRLAPH